MGRYQPFVVEEFARSVSSAAAAFELTLSQAHSKAILCPCAMWEILRDLQEAYEYCEWRNCQTILDWMKQTMERDQHWTSCLDPRCYDAGITLIRLFRELAPRSPGA